jgi:organic hydroperoxide reductase OsmC/OhrA
VTRISVELRNVAGTEAALGWAGAHTLVVDRPEGTAGGGGLGFNGGQLLALAIGGCLCNDLRYAAHEMDVALHEIAVTVALEIDGAPPLAREAVATLRCVGDDAAEVAAVVARARAGSTVANSVARGFPVTLVLEGAGA